MLTLPIFYGQVYSDKIHKVNYSDQADKIKYIQSDLYYPRNSIIRGFWGQNLVRRTYMKYSKTYIIHTSIIRGTR